MLKRNLSQFRDQEMAEEVVAVTQTARDVQTAEELDKALGLEQAKALVISFEESKF